MNTKPKHFWWNETPWHSFFRSLFESFLVSFKKLVDLSRSTLLGFGYVENYRERFETRLWRSFYDVNLLLFLYLQTFSKNEERYEDPHRFPLIWLRWCILKKKTEEFECVYLLMFGKREKTMEYFDFPFASWFPNPNRLDWDPFTAVLWFGTWFETLGFWIRSNWTLNRFCCRFLFVFSDSSISLLLFFKLLPVIASYAWIAGRNFMVQWWRLRK
jgi:hypothetical protein